MESETVMMWISFLIVSSFLFLLSDSQKFHIHQLDFAFVSSCKGPCFGMTCENDG